MLSLLLLRGWRRRRRILSECQSQDSQHLKSSSSSQYHYHHGQTDKTVARSISHLFIRPPQQQSHSDLRHLFLLGSLSRHSSSPPSSLSASLPTYSRGAAAESGPSCTMTSKVTNLSRSHEEPGPHSAATPPPLLLLFAFALIYMASSVPVPSRDESSPLPEPPRADEAGINPLALESSALEAIDPARLFVNREGGSPPRPRFASRRGLRC